MPYCIDLHYLQYYRYDLHCGISGDWFGEVSCFLLPLSLSQLCQSDNKNQKKRKKKKTNSGYGTTKTKDKFITTTVFIFLY